MSLENQILTRLRTVLTDEKAVYPLHEPNFTGNESKYVQDCIDSGWVSSVGRYVNQFESELSAFVGSENAIATMNGTAALHICLLLSDVSPGDEVLVPALTFVATANAVSYCGANPHFVDSDQESLGVDAERLHLYLSSIAVVKNKACFNRKTGRRIKALCVTHIFGQPADLEALLKVCEHFGLTLIEDAAEALGSFYKGRHVGNLSHMAAISFNGNKIITAGGGGAILTNSSVLAERARHLTTTAKLQHEWDFIHDEVGYNYRMPNINAALVCAQLERIDEYLKLKRMLAEKYQRIFEGMKEVTVLKERSEMKSNYWLNALLIKSGDKGVRDSLLTFLSQAGIASRPIWELMHRLPMYVDCPRMDLSNAEALWEKIILLPSSPTILSGAAAKNDVLAHAGVL